MSLLIAGFIAGLGLIWYFGRDLPDYNQLEKYDPPVVTRMHAGDGNLFAEYAHEKRMFVPIEAIPKKVIDTFLAVEDKNFFIHPGLDWTGIARAFASNVLGYFKKSRTTMGGSTITQQVAKNFLLTSERTLTRKIKEAILSLRIEKTFSKRKILELYLNEIYLGSGTYGIASAALKYFNKSLEQLTPAECAYIAGLPKAPSNYHPKRHYKAALKRRNWVITRMFEEKIITQQEALHAVSTPIILGKRKANVIDTNYFAEHIRQEVIKKYGEETFYRGGLSVRTTLDSKLQKLADRTLRKGLIRYDRRFGWRGPLRRISLENWETSLSKVPPPAGLKPWSLAVVLKSDVNEASIGLYENGEIIHGIISLGDMTWAKKHRIQPSTGYPTTGPDIKSVSEVLNPGDVIAVQKVSGKNYSLEQIPEVNGAIIALDPHTGRILALDGGYRFNHSQFNRATQAKRQPGSVLKPLIYAAAFEKGYTPATMVLDAPIVMELGNGQVWKPQNITKKFYGLVPLREALENSYNLSILRVAQDVGMEKIEEFVKRLGAYDSFSHELANILGAEETTLLKLVTAYASFVNGGKKVIPVTIDRIQDRHGKSIYTASTRTYKSPGILPWKNQLPPTLEDSREQVMDPAHAYQIVSLLEGAVKRGTSKRGAVSNHNVAGKTGTSSNYFDTWFIGFSPNLVVGVVVGFDNPKSLGRYQTGATVAAPIFGDFIREALKGQPPIPFRIPSNIKFKRIKRKSKTVSQETFLEAFSSEDSSPEFSGLISDETNGIY